MTIRILHELCKRRIIVKGMGMSYSENGKATLLSVSFKKSYWKRKL